MRNGKNRSEVESPSRQHFRDATSFAIEAAVVGGVAAGTEERLSVRKAENARSQSESGADAVERAALHAGLSRMQTQKVCLRGSWRACWLRASIFEMNVALLSVFNLTLLEESAT
jgi:hypothetical protein